jgi:alpha-beta hydrolase superfamily lysophospholipase
MVDFGIGLVRFLKMCKGAYGKSRLMDYIVSGNCDKVFSKENLKSSWITSDRKVVEAYNADPYCNYKFTLNGYEALLLLMKKTYSKKAWKLANKNLPIHFIAGAEDPYITNAEKFGKAVQFLRDRGYKKVTSKLYDGMRHEVLNEKNKAIVYTDMKEFCEKIVNDK